MSIIMFDTNAYRYFGEKLKGMSVDEQNGWISTLCNREQENKNSKELNFWVACELLKHLEDPEDKDYESCQLALRTALGHCSFMNKYRIAYPIEGEICEHYKNEECVTYYRDLYTGVAKLINEFFTNGRSEAFVKYIPEISILISTFQDQIGKGYELAKEELKQAKDLQALKKNEYMNDDAYKMILRSIIHNTAQIDEKISDEDLEYFFNKFYFGLARTCKIMGKEIAGKKFPNNIIDTAICLRIGLNDNRILVTDDGKNEEGILSTFKSANAYPAKAMTLEEYFKLYDFEIDGPEKAVAV